MNNDSIHHRSTFISGKKPPIQDWFWIMTKLVVLNSALIEERKL